MPALSPISTMSGDGISTVAGVGAGVSVPGGPWVLLLGDSKTAGDAWYGTLRLSLPGLPLMVDNAIGGTTASGTALIIDGRLVSGQTVTPRYALINFGANDLLALPSQAAWTASYLVIIDAVLALWPDAPIYLMRPWRRSDPASCDLMATWLAGIVAARPANVHLGPDERIWFAGADNGVALAMADGIHYNTPAGQNACAAAWLALLP